MYTASVGMVGASLQQVLNSFGVIPLYIRMYVPVISHKYVWDAYNKCAVYSMHAPMCVSCWSAATTVLAHTHTVTDAPPTLSPVLSMVLSGELCDWSCCKDAWVVGLEAFVHHKAPIKHQVSIIDCFEHVHVHRLLVQTEAGLRRDTT